MPRKIAITIDCRFSAQCVPVKRGFSVFSYMCFLPKQIILIQKRIAVLLIFTNTIGLGLTQAQNADIVRGYFLGRAGKKSRQKIRIYQWLMKSVLPI